MDVEFEDGSVKLRLGTVVEIAEAAGEAILEIYQQPEDKWNQQVKSDKSPLTDADLNANGVLCERLQKNFPDVPIMSEENKQAPYEERRKWTHYWCIDPLDGTKEFLKRNGEFTVNIALVKVGGGGDDDGSDVVGEPVLGVVHTPAQSRTHFAAKRKGAYVRDMKDGSEERIGVKRFDEGDEGLVIVCSRSHLDANTRAFIEKYKNPESVSRGSSLKFMLVAEGKAHVYPRLAPTMEWDTAAAQAVLEEAGGEALQFDSGRRVVYNKRNLLNPFFVCYGRRTG